MTESRREKINIRIDPTGLAEIDRLAAAEDRTRSAMIRVLLAEAVEARRGRVARRRPWASG